ncbi:hypothetical protein BLNAU_20351 [Blattamonas nauphoetae]|uniref:Protein kinase domain-containing protein n=1 Tax=Blattamonas nauphoetae TaxID=2049346 RepID=A0ABQ9WZ24_9EUKA|nr:hypothetical protein BLNAU_20351 [Blattamonas nauphoetae]
MVKLKNLKTNAVTDHSLVITSTDSCYLQAVIWAQSTTPQLSQGESYEIVGVSVQSTPVFYHAGITFKVDGPRSRMISFGTLSNGEDLNTTTIPITGELMPTGTYTIQFIDLTHYSQTQELSEPTINVLFKSETEGSMEIELYPSAELVYGHLYVFKSLTNPSSVSETIVSHLSTITMPTEPSRLEIVEFALTDDEKSLDINLIGKVFDSGTFSLTLQQTSSNGLVNIPVTLNPDNTLSCSISTVQTDTTHLVFGQTYEIVEIKKNGAAIIINPKAKEFTVPKVSQLENVTFEITNMPVTSFKLILEGEGFDVNTNYVLTLTSGHTFPVTFTSSMYGETSWTNPIGWTDTLCYSTQYVVDSLTVQGKTKKILSSAKPFTTLKRPSRITLFVDMSSTSTLMICGDSDVPCSSIRKAWDVAEGLGHTEITLNVLRETKELESILITKEMSVLLQNGMNFPPIIRVPATASHSDGSGLITVSEGRLELKNVEVAIESTSDLFVFLFGVNASIVIETCTLDGVNIPVSVSNSADICEWTSGIIQLDNCSSKIDWTKFHELPQGALNMKGGTITIDSSVFRDNTPNFSSFPSVRRNILCSGEGEVNIGTLSSGDGTQTTPSPTKTKSKVTKEVYDVILAGSVLIPCGLGLEILEWDESKKTYRNSEIVDLAGLNTSEWIETSVSFKLNRKDIKIVDQSFELHARLAFGQEQSTDNHFVLKISDAAARKAQSLEQAKNTLPWLIPVIVATVLLLLLIIIFLICRRHRNQKKDKENLLKNQEMDVTDPMLQVEKMEVADTPHYVLNAPNTNNIIDNNIPSTAFGTKPRPAQKMNSHDEATRMSMHGRAESEMKIAVRCGVELEETPVNKNDTLYNRLHKSGRPIDTQHVFRMITRGVAQLAKQNPQMPILTRLSPLWIYLDAQDAPLFQLKDDNVTNQNNVPESSFFPGSNHGPMNSQVPTAEPQNRQQAQDCQQFSHSQSLTVNPSIRSIEGQRWMAPEVAGKKTDIDPRKAAVFSLGLILWELETGLVPFGEIDAVNAQRQLGCGTLPKMDSWTNETKAELIRSCLSLDPKERPSLDEIVNLLETDVELSKPAFDKQANGIEI